jgi:hypothetical protein
LAGTSEGLPLRELNPGRSAAAAAAVLNHSGNRARTPGTENPLLKEH